MKYVQAILPFMKNTMNSIKHGAGFCEMSSNDVLNEIIAMKISEKNVDDALACAHGTDNPNLDLKAKVAHKQEEEEEEASEEEY
jgi:hypothetical protein